eukprot:4232018-Amphidinium_carterae.1
MGHMAAAVGVQLEVRDIYVRGVRSNRGQLCPHDPQKVPTVLEKLRAGAYTITNYLPQMRWYTRSVWEKNSEVKLAAIDRMGEIRFDATVACHKDKATPPQAVGVTSQLPLTMWLHPNRCSTGRFVFASKS